MGAKPYNIQGDIMENKNGIILRKKKGSDMGAMFKINDVNSITWIDDRFDSGKYFVTVYVKESKFQEKMDYDSLEHLLKEWTEHNGEDFEFSEEKVGLLNSKDW